jgi:hypothetical protein
MTPGDAILKWLGRKFCYALCFIAKLLPPPDGDPSTWRDPRS